MLEYDRVDMSEGIVVKKTMNLESVLFQFIITFLTYIFDSSLKYVMVVIV